MIQGEPVRNRSLPCMAVSLSASETREQQEQELEELEINIKRLRIEYEQFFRGAMKREPSVLRGKVQKVITRFVSDPPRNPAIKFRFNSLNARYQSFRQLWGRTLREIEAGTYAPHRFRMKVNSEQTPTRRRSSTASSARARSSRASVRHPRGRPSIACTTRWSRRARRPASRPRSSRATSSPSSSRSRPS